MGPKCLVYNGLSKEYPGFYNGRVHVVGGGPRSLGDGSPSVGSRGKAPVGSLETKSPRS